MIEFGKIFCDLHPNELVTNYCCRGKSNFIQRSAMWASAPPASAVIPNRTFIVAQPQTTRTLGPLTPTCTIHSGHASRPSSTKRVALYPLPLPRTLSSKPSTTRKSCSRKWSSRPGTRLSTS